MKDENMQWMVRRTRRTVHLVAGMYVTIGLVVSGAGALTGDRISAFLGFMIVAGALGAAAMFGVVFRTVARMGTLDKAVGDMRSSLARIERLLEENHSASQSDRAEQVRVLNLASVGGGELGAITAATLDRSGFPRLVTAMGTDQPVANGADRPTGDMVGPTPEFHPFEESSQQTMSPGEVVERDLRQTWSAAMRRGDLLACRTVYDALVDLAESETVSAMAASLDALALRHERRIRRRFAECIQTKQFAKALAIGAEIGPLFPNHPLSDEFERLRPILERRALSGDQDPNVRKAAST